MKKRITSQKSLFLLAFLLCLFFFRTSLVYADSVGLILRGLIRTVTAAVEIPRSMLEDSAHLMFPLGIVTGAIKGAVRTVAGTVLGAADMARGAAPYAKYAVFAM